MKEVISEVLKKINSENIIWFALAFFVVTSAIIFLPNLFKGFTRTFEGVGIISPYSIMLVFVFYLSASIIIMRPTSLWATLLFSKIKKKLEFKSKSKIIENLPEVELLLLQEFVVRQNTKINVDAEYVHVARILKHKGLLYSGFYGPANNGSEDFFMTDDLLDYLTIKYKDNLQEIRKKLY